MLQVNAVPSRFEMKYVVAERQAVAIRDYIWHHVESDEHMPSGETKGYRVCSLYMESSGRDIYRQAVAGASRRYKLRLRFYSDDPKSLVFAEIKRRVNQVVVKHRAVVSREIAQELASSQPVWPIVPPKTGAVECTASDAGLAEFVHLRDHIQASGLLFVSYIREAYVSRHGDHARVTFDRDVRGCTYQVGEQLLFPTIGVTPLLGKVVLELKFTERCPNWMVELVRHFNLDRTSVAKYVLCLQAAGLAPD